MRPPASAVHARCPVACQIAVAGRAALALSSPVIASRRSAGMPAARLAESWRMRRSPPEQGSWLACRAAPYAIPVDQPVRLPQIAGLDQRPGRRNHQRPKIPERAEIVTIGHEQRP
jgi:hypothetical protein